MELKIEKILEQDMTFEEYFVCVCELKVSLDKEHLKILRNVVKKNVNRYPANVVAYLCDCIDTEKLLPCNRDTRKTIELQMKNEVIKNFAQYFPEYTFIETEKVVSGVGRIDIFASHNNKPVIIELKIAGKSPNAQLIAYSSKFKGAELIGITEKEIPEELKISDIKYFTITELRQRIIRSKSVAIKQEV